MSAGRIRKQHLFKIVNRRGHTKSHPQPSWKIARRRQIREDVHHTISNFLETYAKGMFIWVVMIIKEMERQDERSTDEITIRLARMPLTIMETYDTVIHAAPPTCRRIMFLYYVQMV